MLSISPKSADIVTAVRTAVSIFALPGCRYDEKPPAAESLLAKNTLTADDIPFDMKPGPDFPHPAVKPKFIHQPTITHRRIDETFAVTGPIEPTIPHTTPATHAGWEKWFGDVADAKDAAIKAAAIRRAAKNQYFQTRDDNQKIRDAEKEAKYEARCKRALAQGKPIPKRPKYREAPPDVMNYVKDEELVAKVAEARSDRTVAQRMREFVHDGSIPIAGRRCAAFKESFEHEDATHAPAIRSWLGITALLLLSSALPKSVTFGYDKEVEYSGCLQRIFALDKPYIVLDKGRRCAFIVDLDGWWVSVASLRAHLRKLLPPHLMPNIITCRGAEDGKGGAENPHLVWMLPPGSRVIRGKGRRTREQFRLHEMIQAAIVSHLIPIGADPGHTNVFKTKNPLSAAYSVETCDDFFATMDDWRSYLPTITPDKREMMRRAKVHKATQQSGAPIEQSQAIWNDGAAYRSIEIKAAQRRKDPAYLKSIKKHVTFVDWLYHSESGVMTKRLVKIHGDTPAVRSVLRAQRDFVVQLNLTPSAIGEFSDRGRDHYRNRLKDCPVAGPMATAEERKLVELYRKSQGGKQSRSNMKVVHCGLIAEEIESRMGSGVPVVEAEVVNALVKAGTVSRSVAYAHYDHVLEVVLQTARYQEHLFASKSQQSGHQIEAAHVSIPDPVFGDQNRPVIVQSPVETSVQVRNPAKPIIPGLPRPSAADLRQWTEAYLRRESWRRAVAAWRAAGQQRHEVDLSDDPIFAAVVLHRSSWSHHRH